MKPRSDLGGEHELVVQHPLRRLVEQRRARVDVDGVALHHGAVAFLGVLLGGVREVPRHDGAPDLVVVPTGREDVHLRSRLGGAEWGDAGV